MELGIYSSQFLMFAVKKHTIPGLLTEEFPYTRLKTTIKMPDKGYSVSILNIDRKQGDSWKTKTISFSSSFSSST